MSHDCAQCNRSKAEAEAFKGSRVQCVLFRSDEWLHRYECEHGNHPRLWRVRSAFCNLVDWRVNGVPLRALYRKGPKTAA